MKVLIIRFSSVGDIVLTTPVIRAIKTQLEATVHYCTKANFAFLFDENPYVDKVHTLDGDFKQLVKQLKAEKYDAIIDLHHNLRTLRLQWALGARSYSFDKLNLQKWLMVNFKINRLPNVHIVDRYLDAASPLGIKPDNLGLDYFIPEKDEVERQWLPEAFHEEFVVFGIGGQHATKRLPLHKMITLCDKINKPVLLLGGPEDYDTGEDLRQFFEKTANSAPYEEKLKEMGKKTVVFNGCGKFSFNQSASLIKQANYVFTHDTGVMHIAAAFYKETFTIWGNTIPLFGMYPYKTKFTVFENNQLGCRPCSKIGHGKCPKGHFKCMNDLTFDFYLP